MRLHIKNMVCDRCVFMVKSELEQLGLHPNTVELGIAEIDRELEESEKIKLLHNLQKLGFDIINDRKNRLVERLKTAIIEKIHYSGRPSKFTLSQYLSQKFQQDYSTLSKKFSEIQGVTLEQYVIQQKIEKVKELLDYDEDSLSEIAHQLDYSSVSHLSKQFKKITGLTPTQFRKGEGRKRLPLDQL